MQVLLCGGGNATHVLACMVSRAGHKVHILSLYGDEASRFRTISQKKGGELRCVNDMGDDYVAMLDPSCIQDDPKSVVPGTDMVIMAIPSFAHEMYARAIGPYLLHGAIIGAMPAEGGFDYCVTEALGHELSEKCTFFGLETLPWTCRYIEFGCIGEILGTKRFVDACVRPALPHTKESVLEILQTLVGDSPKLTLASSFLGVTLMNINSVWHPTITYGAYRSWDAATPFDNPPLFYESVDDFTAEKLTKISDEVLQVVAALKKKYPNLDLTEVRHVREWMKRAYGDDITDTSSLKAMLTSNKGYRGLTHPMVRNPNGDGFLPDFTYRYITEDVPFGLLVTRGIAEVVGVATPTMDEVIEWAQSRINKEFLVDGHVAGKDVSTTRCPQRYGFTELETFLKVNQYIC